LDFDALDQGPNPERAIETKELMDALRVMPESDQVLLYEAFVDGVIARGEKDKVEDARKRAEAILTNLLKGVELKRRMPRRQRHPKIRGENTMAKKEESVPECHTEGADPVGYETDLEDAQDCQDCLDKATCLTAGIKSGLIDAELGIDPEVKGWHQGLITMSDLRDRINQRVALREKGKEIPEAMTFDHPPVSKEAIDKAADKPRGEKKMKEKADKKKGSKKAAKKKATKTEEDAPKEAPAPKKAAKKKAKPEAKAAKKKGGKKKAKPEAKADAPKAKKKGGKKKAAKKKAPAKPKKKSKPLSSAPCNRKGEKGHFRHPGTPKDLPDGRIQLPNGRFIAAPKEIDKERMQTTLAGLNGKLGLDFDLTIGMKLVQERRKGEDMVISLKKNGYHLNLTDGTYGSLSGAVCAAFRRIAVGTTVFNFNANNNIIVKGKAVPGGSFRRG
jgi:hypothetical protein